MYDRSSLHEHNAVNVNQLELTRIHTHTNDYKHLLVSKKYPLVETSFQEVKRRPFEEKRQ